MGITSLESPCGQVFQLSEQQCLSAMHRLTPRKTASLQIASTSNDCFWLIATKCGIGQDFRSQPLSSLLPIHGTQPASSRRLSAGCNVPVIKFTRESLYIFTSYKMVQPCFGSGLRLKRIEKTSEEAGFSDNPFCQDSLGGTQTV